MTSPTVAFARIFAMRRILAGMRAPADEAAARRMQPEPERLPDWLPATQLEHYVEEFTRTGFTGALN